jgi:hypothetical protein
MRHATCDGGKKFLMNQPATRAKTQVLTLLRGTAPKETGFNANSACKKVTETHSTPESWNPKMCGTGADWSGYGCVLGNNSLSLARALALSRAMMPTPGETAGASAYYGDGEARWLAYIEIGCRFTEEANR